MKIDPVQFLKKIRRHTITLGVRTTADRVFLIEELVDRGIFRSKSEFLETAIDELLKQHFPEYFEGEDAKLLDFDEQEVTA